MTFARKGLYLACLVALAACSDDSTSPQTSANASSGSSGLSQGNVVTPADTSSDVDADPGVEVVSPVSDGASIQLEGVFLDGPTQGLEYRSISDADGENESLTSAAGEFSYTPGETLAFSIGGIQLGSSLGMSILTPLSLAEPRYVLSNSLVNMLRLIYTLDDDGDSSNGITVTEAVRMAAGDMAMDFSKSPASFDADYASEIAELTGVTSVGARELLTRGQAIGRFADMLEKYPTADPRNEAVAETRAVSGTFTVDSIGTYTIPTSTTSGLALYENSPIRGIVRVIPDDLTQLIFATGEMGYADVKVINQFYQGEWSIEQRDRLTRNHRIQLGYVSTDPTSASGAEAIHCDSEAVGDDGRVYVMPADNDFLAVSETETQLTYTFETQLSCYYDTFDGPVSPDANLQDNLTPVGVHTVTGEIVVNRATGDVYDPETGEDTGSGSEGGENPDTDPGTGGDPDQEPGTDNGGDPGTGEPEEPPVDQEPDTGDSNLSFEVEGLGSFSATSDLRIGTLLALPAGSARFQILQMSRPGEDDLPGFEVGQMSLNIPSTGTEGGYTLEPTGSIDEPVFEFGYYRGDTEAGTTETAVRCTTESEDVRPQPQPGDFIQIDKIANKTNEMEFALHLACYSGDLTYLGGDEFETDQLEFLGVKAVTGTMIFRDDFFSVDDGFDVDIQP